MCSIWAVIPEVAVVADIVGSWLGVGWLVAVAWLVVIQGKGPKNEGVGLISANEQKSEINCQKKYKGNEEERKEY